MCHLILGTGVRVCCLSCALGLCKVAGGGELMGGGLCSPSESGGEVCCPLPIAWLPEFTSPHIAHRQTQGYIMQLPVVHGGLTPICHEEVERGLTGLWTPHVRGRSTCRSCCGYGYEAHTDLFALPKRVMAGSSSQQCMGECKEVTTGWRGCMLVPMPLP